MTTKYSYIFIVTFFIAAPSLCGEINPQATSFDILHIKAQSLACFDNYAVMQTNTTTCAIYDLNKQQEILEIKKKGPIYCLTKHPTQNLIAISHHADIDNCCDTLSIYTVPKGQQIAQISKNYLFSTPVFSPYTTTVAIKNGSHFFTLNYTTREITQFTKSLGLYPNITQHTIDKSYGAPTTHYTDQLLSTAHHPTKPILALLIAKQRGIKKSNYDHLLVNLINKKSNNVTTLLDQKFDELKDLLNDTPQNAHLIDFFRNGEKIIISLINTCITIDTPKDDTIEM